MCRAGEAAQRVEKLGLYAHKEKSFLGEELQKLSKRGTNINLPSIDVSCIRLQISHVRIFPSSFRIYVFKDMI
jgi:hypothetical protein